MSRISLSLACFVVFFALSTGRGSADVPPHDDICIGGVVSKDKLVTHLIASKNNQGAVNLIVSRRVVSGRVFFTDGQLCKASVVCHPGQKAAACDDEIKACTTAQDLANVDARSFFEDITAESIKPEAIYIEDRSLLKADPNARAQIYFTSPKDTDNRILCTANDVKPPPPKSAIETSQFRVRGISDDLYVDRNDKSTEKAFNATSKATLSSTGDRSTTPTQTLKTKAALGYAFDVSGATVIPYLSFYQSITDTFGKPQNTDPDSNVAVGMLFSKSVVNGEVNHVFGAKPQYLLNTKDHSEIASLRLLYTPYTFFAGDTPNLNFFQPLPFFSMVSAEIIFDLRLDAGAYGNRGNDPVQSLLNTDFVRAGSRFGVAFIADPLTLILTETCLYGFAGSVRNLNIFEASLTYNFNKFVGLTGSYRNGIDEDTAIRVETWMVGFSGRF